MTSFAEVANELMILLFFSPVSCHKLSDFASLLPVVVLHCAADVTESKSRRTMQKSHRKVVKGLLLPPNDTCFAVILNAASTTVAFLL